MPSPTIEPASPIPERSEGRGTSRTTLGAILAIVGVPCLIGGAMLVSTDHSLFAGPPEDVFAQRIVGIGLLVAGAGSAFSGIILMGAPIEGTGSFVPVASVRPRGRFIGVSAHGVSGAF